MCCCVLTKIKNSRVNLGEPTVGVELDDLSNARNYDVQLPKSFNSDSVIYVSSYTTRFSLYL